MFTKNVKPRKRGRPAGPTAQGVATRERLYATALRLIAARGYEATTLRDIANDAGVSVGLLYRYFPSKQAVVIALYDELSTGYARQAAEMPAGRWRDRFIFALNTSLHVLEPHQMALRALTPVLVGDPEEGIFATSTAFSRLRVQHVFEEAVIEASDAPKTAVGGGARPASVPRPFGRASVVAAGQEFKPARNGGTCIAYTATSAFSGDGSSCATRSTICNLSGRIDPSSAVWQSNLRYSCSWPSARRGR